MPRQPRLHINGGFYLLTLRGNGQQPLLADDRDRTELERLLALALRRCRVRLFAYCWLPDRLLLAVRISDTPLGPLVQRFAGPYAQRVQQRTGRAGHLFGRRYDASTIEPESLPHLVRHIHRAPVRAKLVESVADYPWSSHHGYLARARPAWLSVQPTLRAFHRTRAEARRQYSEFVNTDDMKSTPLFECSATPVIGSEAFKRAIAQRTTAPLPFESVDHLIDSVCRTLRVRRDDVLSSARHRPLSRARAVIAWHASRTGLAALKQVAATLGRHTSTLSVAMNRYLSLKPELFELANIRRGPAKPARLSLPGS